MKTTHSVYFYYDLHFNICLGKQGMVHVTNLQDLHVLTSFRFIPKSIMCESIPAMSIFPHANPGHLKKLIKCQTQWAIFVGKCFTPCSYYDGQMPDPQSIKPIYKNICCHF